MNTATRKRLEQLEQRMNTTKQSREHEMSIRALATLPYEDLLTLQDALKAQDAGDDVEMTPELERIYAQADAAYKSAIGRA